MRLELYQAETDRIATSQSALLDVARGIIASGRALTSLEQSGVLHALQVLIENSIGKARQQLKAQGGAVPVSAYDVFGALAAEGLLDSKQIPQWNAIIGLRNRIVHDYMNLDMARVLELVDEGRERFVVDYLRRPITS